MHRQTNPIQQTNHPKPLKTTPKIPIQPYTQPPSHPLTPTNPQGLAPTSPRGPAGGRHHKQTTPKNPLAQSCKKYLRKRKRAYILLNFQKTKKERLKRQMTKHTTRCETTHKIMGKPKRHQKRKPMPRLESRIGGDVSVLVVGVQLHNKNRSPHVMHR